MGKFSEKTKSVLEWFQHGYLLVQLLGSGFVGKTVQALLMTYTHLSSAWITPLWLLASASMMALLVFIGNRLSKRSGQGMILSQTEQARYLVASPSAFDADSFFLRSYYSPLQPEIETNVRAAAAKNQPNDREGFYVKLIGNGLIAYIYDILWLSIFKSQLLALLELNRRNGLMPLADFKPYYNQTATANPAFYANYSFDQWITFMKNEVLILKHPSDMVEITVRGKDFLKYLLHWGREPDQRAL